MRKLVKHLLPVIFILMIITLVGCGGKSQEKVLKKIEDTLGSLQAYKVEATMKMNTGEEERSYDIDIWYNKGEQDFYRVTLESDGEDGGQVILKNEEGVFVLTPSLQKSFKFQTEWPDNSSQPYLYKSLINDVINDKEAVFTTSDSYYVFQTKTNYQNNSNLPFQEVYFDKKTYLPVAVNILDKEKQPLIEVVFRDNNLSPSFAKEDFEREAILEHADTSGMDKMINELAVMYPLEMLGSELVEEKQVKLTDGDRVIMTFKGDKNFTLIQEKRDILPVSSYEEELVGDVINLGHSVGALSDKALEWNYQGANFYLTGTDLSQEDLINVASSIQGKSIK